MSNADDNQTTKLRKLLDERGVEYEADERNAITEWSTHYGAFVFFARQREGKLLVETTVATKHSVILTPEQAIVATLGSDREKALEELVRDLMKFTDRYIGIPLGDEADFFDAVEKLNERIDELGIEVDE